MNVERGQAEKHYEVRLAGQPTCGRAALASPIQGVACILWTSRDEAQQWPYQLPCADTGKETSTAHAIWLSRAIR